MTQAVWYALLALKPRYTRDQLSIVIKLQEAHSTDMLETAVTYCLERNLFGASDFKDTLEYFTQKSEPPILRDIHIPMKYSIVTAQTRPLDVYTALMTKVGGAL